MSHEHEHGHTHEHANLEHDGEPRLPPSRQGTVVLDIGDGVGALVVHTSSQLCGVEIEIARRGETNAFVHTEVRERVLPEGSVYAGVFVELPEGDYTLLGLTPREPDVVTIHSGRVTEVALAS